MVINMDKNKIIKTRLYFCFSVLLLTAVCIVVYTAMRSEDHANMAPPQLVQEQPETANRDATDLQQVNQTVQNESYRDRQTEAVAPDVPDSDSVTTGPTTYGITVTDGYLQVYIVENGALYMETAIAYDLLPERVQAQIDEGKYFESEEDLLEFLENYSS